MRVADGQDVTGRVSYTGNYCINDDGSNLRDFTRLGAGASGAAGAGTGVNIVPVRAMGPESPEYIVSMRYRSRDSSDLYNFNTETGQAKLLTFDTPGNVVAWTMDRNRVPRVAVRAEDRVGNQPFTMRNVWLRSGEGAKWEKIAEHKVTWGQPHTEVLEPLAFDYDNTTLYVSTNIGGRDKKAIYKYDTTTKKLGELVFEHPLIDVEGGLLFSDEKKKLVGIRYSAEMPATKWLDPELDSLQKQLDATLQGNINTIGVVRRKIEAVCC